MKRTIIAFIAAVLLMSCNQKVKKSSGRSENAEIKEECYALENGKDTIRMQLRIQDNDSVKGKLLYKIYEKDGNYGKLNGTFKNDRLLAYYTFNSEGKNSVRQVYFAKTDHGLAEGFGPIETRNDSVLFANPDSIKINKNLILKKIACDQGVK